MYYLAICKEISTIKNGRVVGGGSLEGEKVTFVCDKNYVIVGQRALKCTGNGKWNASEPKCEGKRIFILYNGFLHKL